MNYCLKWQIHYTRVSTQQQQNIVTVEYIAVKYDFKSLDQKWQDYWEKNPIKLSTDTQGKKYYCLDMFPYPSGAGLHMGHWKSYLLSDIYARIKWLDGYQLLHPMGWDAFGSPAENYAIKQGVHPKISTAENIATFKRQLKQTGCLYNWDREIDTTDPKYYKWTQWIFVKMFKAGLAYEADFPLIGVHLALQASLTKKLLKELVSVAALR